MYKNNKGKGETATSWGYTREERDNNRERAKNSDELHGYLAPLYIGAQSWEHLYLWNEWIDNLQMINPVKNFG